MNFGRPMSRVYPNHSILLTLALKTMTCHDTISSHPYRNPVPTMSNIFLNFIKILVP